MKTPHTPGPWFTQGYDVGPAPDCTVAIVCEAGSNDDEGQSNARLIAAAPALLAALNDLVLAEGLPQGYANRGILMDAARAAIAQATGEQA